MISLVEITALRLESKLPPMRPLEFIRDHVTFKLPYDFSYQMKTPMIPYKFKCSHCLKLQHLDWRANLVKDFVLQINFQLMRALKFIMSHVIFKLRYNHIDQLKTTLMLQCNVYQGVVSNLLQIRIYNFVWFLQIHYI